MIPVFVLPVSSGSTIEIDKSRLSNLVGSDSVLLPSTYKFDAENTALTDQNGNNPFVLLVGDGSTTSITDAAGFDTTSDRYELSHVSDAADFTIVVAFKPQLNTNALFFGDAGEFYVKMLFGSASAGSVGFGRFGYGESVLAPYSDGCTIVGISCHFESDGIGINTNVVTLTSNGYSMNASDFSGGFENYVAESATLCIGQSGNALFGSANVFALCVDPSVALSQNALKAEVTLMHQRMTERGVITWPIAV